MGKPRSVARGYYVERKLVALLSSKPGNYVFRIPVSGGSARVNSPTALPDVFLVNNVEDRIVAFEVKGTSRKKVKVKREQLMKLFKFLEPFKKYSRREAVVAVWFFSEGKWVFKKIEDGLCPEEVCITVDDESNWEP